MTGVFQKEMSRFFHTMTGYVFIAMFLAVASAVFVSANLAAQNGDIKVFFSSATTLIAFLIPILTMGAFADERRQKTDELLLSSPVSLTRVVLGKFFATMCMFFIPLALTAIYPAVLFSLGAWQPLETAGNYAGLMLLASALVSGGLFVSMLTDSPFVAAMLTYSALALTVLAGGAAGAVTGAWGAALSFCALTAHVSAFALGVFDWGAALYYLSLTALFLFLCVYALERRRLS